MTRPAISVRNLSKTFRVWNKPADMLKEAITGTVRHVDFQALSDISFDVERGSVVGLLGRNGAGKSTLLRIIAGTLDSSGGSVSVAGRIAAILELGTGFHPEYSGRENVFLGGMCLGMTREQIRDRFDEIVDFAELWDFIDQPFRTYSSGMQGRLTFAVATSVDPDVLIVDEALAVGDARFALKSFDRIRRFKEAGKSILLVSHSINQINTICDHAILLEKGRVVAEGEPAQVGNIYHELLFGTVQDQPSQLSRTAGKLPVSAAATATDAPAVSGPASDNPIGDAVARPAQLTAVDPVAGQEPLPADGDVAGPSDREHRYGDGGATITAFYIADQRGEPTNVLRSTETYTFVLQVTATRDLEDLSTGFLIRTPMGVEVFGANTHLIRPFVRFRMNAGQSTTLKATFRANLAHGTYFASGGLATRAGKQHDFRFDALQFIVEPVPFIHDASLANLEMKFQVPDEILEPHGQL
ncbi:MAG: ABC transporter ATP-binding protein [Gammaproteobacteria bacterium]|nr:ABC transporter ATP-binding protein [Gammaproteobacteria bacterium]